VASPTSAYASQVDLRLSDEVRLITFIVTSAKLVISFAFLCLMVCYSR